MSMEHRRPNGNLSQGYFCLNCGEPCAMMGHGNCISNPKLVKACQAANPKVAGQEPVFTDEEFPVPKLNFTPAPVEEIDFTQIEKRIMAATEYVDYHVDPHTKEAMRIFEVNEDQVTHLMRRMAKTVYFIKLYGKRGK